MEERITGYSRVNELAQQGMVDQRIRADSKDAEIRRCKQDAIASESKLTSEEVLVSHLNNKLRITHKDYDELVDKFGEL